MTFDEWAAKQGFTSDELDGPLHELAGCWIAARMTERERIADLFEGQYTDTCPQTNISRAIRALEDE